MRQSQCVQSIDEDGDESALKDVHFGLSRNTACYSRLSVLFYILHRPRPLYA